MRKEISHVDGITSAEHTYKGAHNFGSLCTIH